MGSTEYLSSLLMVELPPLCPVFLYLHSAVLTDIFISNGMAEIAKHINACKLCIYLSVSQTSFINFRFIDTIALKETCEKVTPFSLPSPHTVLSTAFPIHSPKKLS